MRAIIAIWNDGRVECYSTVKSFLRANPDRNYDTIMYYLQRKEIPYIDDEVQLHRVTVQR